MNMKRFTFRLVGASLLTLAFTACGAPGTGFDNPFTIPLTMTFTPGSVSATPGTSTHVAVSVSTSTGLNVTGSSFSASAGADQGITLKPDSTGFSINISTTTMPGSYGIPIIATSGNGKASGNLAVTVTPPTTTP